MRTRALRSMLGALGRNSRTGASARPSRESSRHALVGHPHLWEMKRRFQFEFLISRGLRAHDRLLDIGCGTLRGGIPLIEYLQTGHYAGIEARASALAEGRRELAEAGLEHKRPLLIHTSDPGQVRLEQRVDVAWAFSVLFHMRDDALDAYLGLIATALTDTGSFYANVNLGERRMGEWQGFPVLWRPRELYASMAASHGLAMSDVGTLEALGHHSGSPAQDRQMMLRFTSWRNVGLCRKVGLCDSPEITSGLASRPEDMSDHAIHLR